jgi:hypothetical protein
MHERFLSRYREAFRAVTARGPDWRIAAVLFLLSLCLVEWHIGDRLELSLDEGIYLDGAVRVAHGRVPYRDFFAFTGPGTFWAFGAIFRAAGASLAAARWVLAVEIALLGTGIYWFLAVLTSNPFAAAAASLFVTFCLDSPEALYISHRWDSNTWAMGALFLAYLGRAKSGRGFWIASGGCAAVAAWITPPFVVVAAGIAAWIAWTTGWRAAAAYFAGVAAPSVAAAGILLYQRAFAPMIAQLLWATSHYGAANTVQYGYLAGNPLASLRGAPVLQALVRIARFLESFTPALLPPVAYLGLAALLIRRRPRPLRAACCCFPARGRIAVSTKWWRPARAPSAAPRTLPTWFRRSKPG